MAVNFSTGEKSRTISSIYLDSPTVTNAESSSTETPVSGSYSALYEERLSYTSAKLKTFPQTSLVRDSYDFFNFDTVSSTPSTVGVKSTTTCSSPNASQNLEKTGHVLDALIDFLEKCWFDKLRHRPIPQSTAFSTSPLFQQTFRSKEVPTFSNRPSKTRRCHHQHHRNCRHRRHHQHHRHHCHRVAPSLLAVDDITIHPSSNSVDYRTTSRHSAATSSLTDFFGSASHFRYREEKTSAVSTFRNHSRILNTTRLPLQPIISLVTISVHDETGTLYVPDCDIMSPKLANTGRALRRYTSLPIMLFSPTSVQDKTYAVSEPRIDEIKSFLSKSMNCVTSIDPLSLDESGPISILSESAIEEPSSECGQNRLLLSSYSVNSYSSCSNQQQANFRGSCLFSNISTPSTCTGFDCSDRTIPSFPPFDPQVQFLRPCDLRALREDVDEVEQFNSVEDALSDSCIEFVACEYTTECRIISETAGANFSTGQPSKPTISGYPSSLNSPSSSGRRNATSDVSTTCNSESISSFLGNGVVSGFKAAYSVVGGLARPRERRRSVSTPGGGGEIGAISKTVAYQSGIRESIYAQRPLPTKESFASSSATSLNNTPSCCQSFGCSSPPFSTNSRTVLEHSSHISILVSSLKALLQMTSGEQKVAAVSTNHYHHWHHPLCQHRLCSDSASAPDKSLSINSCVDFEIPFLARKKVPTGSFPDFFQDTDVGHRLSLNDPSPTEDRGNTSVHFDVSTNVCGESSNSAPTTSSPLSVSNDALSSPTYTRSLQNRHFMAVASALASKEGPPSSEPNWNLNTTEDSPFKTRSC